MNLLRFGIVLLLSVSLWGCGKGNSSAPVTIDPSTGKHTTANMAVPSTGGAHVNEYFANPSSCEGCHGNPQDLSGGIVKVSCSTVNRSGMTCHAGKFPHGIGFNDPVLHGVKVRNAPIGANGIAFCKKCHGSDYRGVAGSGVSCIACHKLTTPTSNAPHAGNWLNGTFKHSATDQANAPACGECHLGGQKLSTPVALPAGTPTPTCFGATALCHFEAGHAVPYIAKTAHGTAARNNLMGCATCHATYPAGSTVPDFNLTKNNANLTAPNGCQHCHLQAGLAHPYAWLPGRGTTAGQAGANTTNHATANFGTSGAYCSPCHATTGTAGLVNSVAPSCMTQNPQVSGTTLCHFTLSPIANTTGCVSCHAYLPTGPNGSSTPNRTGKHAAHFSKITGLSCPDCHGVYGTGRTDHANGLTNFAFAAKFSETGAGFSALTSSCSAISCHGGQSVAWTATTSLGCLNCHNLMDTAGNTGGQYINVFSGDITTGNPNGVGSLNLHTLHITEMGVTPQCTNCHDATKLAALHFVNILSGNTKTLTPGMAAGTLGNPTDTNNKIISYSYTGTVGQISTCLAKSGGCHTAARSWFQ